MAKRQRLERNIQNAKDYLDDVKTKFDIDSLKRQHNEYTKGKKRGNKISIDHEILNGNRLYINFMQRKNRLVEYEQELALLNEDEDYFVCLGCSEHSVLSESSEESVLLETSEVSETSMTQSYCMNCFRYSNQHSPPLNIHIILRYNVRQSSTKFRTVDSAKKPNENTAEKTRQRAEETVQLCDECHNSLNSGLPFTRKQANSYEFLWPSFNFKFLIDQKNINYYGMYELWKYIPDSWRGWWLKVANRFDDTITITYPAAKFVDITNSIDEFKSDIESYDLSRLMSCSNKVRSYVLMVYSH